MGVELLFWIFIGGAIILTGYSLWLNWDMVVPPKKDYPQYITRLEAPDYYKDKPEEIDYVAILKILLSDGK